MQVLSLELSADSLIVATALATVVPLRHMAPLAILFGTCDGLASLIGPMTGFQIPASTLFAPFILVIWGGILALNLSAIRPLAESPLWAYVLPPLLALDNLVVPNSEWLSVGLVSSAMAALGCAVSFVVWRQTALDQVIRRWAGVPLALAGLWAAM